MQKVLDVAKEYAESISRLLKDERVTQALVLAYSAIDTMAWANKQAGDVNRSDFISWADTYMQPESALGCKAQDIYAARCGLLHAGTAESAMSRSGKAVELWYVSGKGERTTLEKLIAREQVSATVLSCEDFLKAFMDGAASFSDDLDRDPERLSQVEKRILAWLSFVPLKETVGP